MRDVAEDMGCSTEAVRNWVKQADIVEGRRDDGPATSAPGEAQISP